MLLIPLQRNTHMLLDMCVCVSLSLSMYIYIYVCIYTHDISSLAGGADAIFTACALAWPACSYHITRRRGRPLRYDQENHNDSNNTSNDKLYYYFYYYYYYYY